MEVQKSLFLILVFILLFSFSQAYKFEVGGRDGWVLNPSESYNHWAERNRFQVNDTIYFKFKKGNDSVLVVTRENYNQCNVKNPIKTLAKENTELKFERSGPHYFISGNEDHCKKGQKLIIVVLAVRPNKSPPSNTPVPAPAPTLSPPSASPAPSPSTSMAPTPSPSTADAPSSSDNKSFALRRTISATSVFLSVVIVAAVFLGC